MRVLQNDGHAGTDGPVNRTIESLVPMPVDVLVAWGALAQRADVEQLALDGAVVTLPVPARALQRVRVFRVHVVGVVLAGCVLEVVYFLQFAIAGGPPAFHRSSVSTRNFGCVSNIGMETGILLLVRSLSRPTVLRLFPLVGV